MIPYKLTFLCLSAVVFLIELSDASPRLSPIVNTTLGQIRGLTSDNGEFYMYMGIPYAQVNRSNSFGKAIPQEPFDEIFDANDDSAECPQIEEQNYTIVGSLDCLHINVYTPITASPSNLLPVMVAFYAGGFVIGSAGRSTYGADLLVKHDVVMVIFNYRLGPFGFMCLNNPEVPGNEGMKDQVLALRWIKENIKAFGGDPNSITAFGNSAGGQSVDFHLVSQSEPLFERGIIQSGPLGPLTTSVSDETAPLQMSAFLGFETDDVYEALSFLSGVHEHDVMNASSSLGLSFGHCIEQQFEGVDAFLTEDWLLASMPKVANMPIMIGFADDEAIAQITAPELFDDSTRILSMIQSSFQYDDPSFEGMADLAQRFYMGDDGFSFDTAINNINFFSDFRFIYTTYRSIERLLNSEVGDLYFYQFSYVGNRNFIRVMNNVTVGGACHADELGYLFDMDIFPDPPNPADQLMIDRITTLWTNFAKYGNPTPQSTELLPVIWEPIRDRSAHPFLDLNAELRMGNRPFYERMSFWDLFYAANGHLEALPSRN